MLPRITFKPFFVEADKPQSEKPQDERVEVSEFQAVLNDTIRVLNLNAEKVFHLYEKPKYDWYASSGVPVNGMVFSPGKGIIPRYSQNLSSVYVRFVVDGKLVEFTGLKSKEGYYAFKDVRVKEIPDWWRWSTEHVNVSRTGQSNMGFFLDFNRGEIGVSKFLSIEIERNPYEALNYIADALDFLYENGEDVKNFALRIYKQIMEKSSPETVNAFEQWITENRERVERWGLKINA